MIDLGLFSAYWFEAWKNEIEEKYEYWGMGGGQPVRCLFSSFSSFFVFAIRTESLFFLNF
jgi:hypothetical protein